MLLNMCVLEGLGVTVLFSVIWTENSSIQESKTLG